MPQNRRRSWVEPYKIKVIEPLKTTREYRERHRRSGLQHLPSAPEDVYIDLLIDSGTNAVSDRQWAGMMPGNGAYAGGADYYNLEVAVRKHYGYPYLVPTLLEIAREGERRPLVEVAAVDHARAMIESRHCTLYRKRSQA